MYFLTAWLCFAKRDMLIVVYEKQEFILKKTLYMYFVIKKKTFQFYYLYGILSYGLIGDRKCIL